MVISRSGRDERKRQRQEFMEAGGADRSKPLHNFSIEGVRWGSQRFLRCMKVNSDGADHPGSSPPSRRMRRYVGEFGRRGSLDWVVSLRKSPPSPSAEVGIEHRRRSRIESDDDFGIESVREKLMHDYRTAVDRVKVSLGGGEAAEESSQPTPVASPAERPWNLRTRRAACKAPIGGGGGGGKGLSPLRTDNKSPSLSPPSLRDAAADTSPEKKERRKFSVSLSRREIGEDFNAITGHRLPRRPKKRPRIVQRQLDSLSPGLWLTEITSDIYKVTDLPA